MKMKRGLLRKLPDSFGCGEEVSLGMKVFAAVAVCLAAVLLAASYLERDSKARIRKNYNATFSGNAVRPDAMSWRGAAAGFLSNKKGRWNDSVIDTAIFRVAVNDGRSLDASPYSHFAGDNLFLRSGIRIEAPSTGKFQGGDGSVWRPNLSASLAKAGYRQGAER